MKPLAEEEIRCPACNMRISSAYKFCPDCGAPSPKPCQQCGTTNSRDARFCIECGFQFEPVTAHSRRDHGGQARPADSSTLAGSEQGNHENPALAVAAEGERRNLTVLLADLTGYTAMNEMCDPEIVRDVLDGRQPVTASATDWPCDTNTSTCRSFATISSGLCFFFSLDRYPISEHSN